LGKDFTQNVTTFAALYKAYSSTHAFGVMEYWSTGVMGKPSDGAEFPILQHSNTPSFQLSDNIRGYQ
jgi:hypothetical protein